MMHDSNLKTSHLPYTYRALEGFLGRSISPKLKLLQAHSALPLEQRAELQKRSLISMLEYASAHVPYYRQLFKKINFSFDKLQLDFKYFQDIPLLSKEIIKEDPKLFLSEQHPSHIFERKTGGSTGVTLNVYYSQEDLDWTAAINLYSLQMTGRTHSDRELHISSNLEHQALHTWKSRWQERIKCLAMNRVNVHTKDFSDQGLQTLFNEIKSKKPFLVQAPCSTLFYLANFASRKSLSSKNLFQVFESTGESLDVQKAQIIAETFGCQIYNRYGNAEFGVVAHSESSFEQLNVFDLVTYAENFTYGSGIPEIVLTGLLNTTMPLIRYRTGDIGEVIGGFGKQILLGVHGRIHDVIDMGNKKIPTHFVKDCLEKIGGINDFQIIIDSKNSLAVSVALNDSSKTKSIETELKRIFGELTKINFVALSELKRFGWRDKFRYLIREQ